jgi:hypothetical protein
MRVRCGLRSNESRFFSTGGRPRRASGDTSSSDHELAFSPPCGGYPRALHVSGTIKTATFTTSPAPSMAAIFLGLVPTVLARSS